jgi:SAM-dependent methyltransferase
MSSGCEQTDAQRAVKRARHAANKARIVAATRAYRETLVRELFAIPVRECTYRCLGRPVSLLRAGCLTPLEELGLGQLRENGFQITVLTVDENRPPFAAAGQPPAASPTAGQPTEGQPTEGDVILGDLRTVPLPPRSFDIVHCALLLDRIPHVELVLDRFTAALRPGGLLLLRIRDRDCAAGLLDRRLPGWARRALWDTLHPGQPGPFPAIYSPVASDRGIQAYMHRRGLVIAQRETAKTPPAGSGRAAWAARAARGLIARLTRGRLTDAHDEVLYVIRKPEDRFARVV